MARRLASCASSPASQNGLIYDATYVNDLEPPAFTLLPLLKDLRDDLVKLGFKAVMMSGSGSTIFCMGMPFSDVLGTWQDELQAKYDVEIFEEVRCATPAT